VAELRRERKVVTVLFADLVGFTARAEELDPEDVEAILRPYHEGLRTELERFGGTVEKFIGDAVMALFGAPLAHEDDPERAVRAALAIRDWVREEGEIQVRVAVNTGEALVNLGARPESGEGMAAGDIVNTTARLQSAAPTNGILVGEATYRATRQAIDYRDGGTVEAKGKSAPVPVWEAVAARSRVTSEAVSVSSPLVGRDRELAVLSELLVRVQDESSPQLVTLVGVPGIGKSRLVHELMQIVHRGGVLTYWRRGRSLPYGEAVPLWALSEIVKAQAGILEGDGADTVRDKLHDEVSRLIPEPREATWVESQLRPLAGVGGEEEQRTDRRDEAFTAWRRFFEGMAEYRPLVLVFEDLHWADDDLLDFVDHLVEWASGVPILIVGTARPELLERRPAWGGGKLNATSLSLAPLSEAHTSRLLASLLDRPLLAADAQAELLARAGGNPLYAEQYAQMLREGADDADPRVPGSIQGVIAARLDLLPPEEKALLQDAAVLGKVFWLGSLAGGRSPSDAEIALHALDRKGFVRRARASSVADESEYTFLHLLVRDVAYGQIPRGARVEKHRRAAEWIESLGRPDEHAETLAYHYLSALELARASGEPTEELADRARHALREAGDRAAALNAFDSAARSYASALELSPADDPQRPRLVLSHATMLALGQESGEEELELAASALAELGDCEGAARAEILLADSDWRAGQRDAADAHLGRAVNLVHDLPNSPAKATVLSEVSRYHMLGDRFDDAIRIGRQALEMATELGLTRCERTPSTTLARPAPTSATSKGSATSSKASRSRRRSTRRRASAATTTCSQVSGASATSSRPPRLFAPASRSQSGSGTQEGRHAGCASSAYTSHIGKAAGRSRWRSSTKPSRRSGMNMPSRDMRSRCVAGSASTETTREGRSKTQTVASHSLDRPRTRKRSIPPCRSLRLRRWSKGGRMMRKAWQTSYLLSGRQTRQSHTTFRRCSISPGSCPDWAEAKTWWKLPSALPRERSTSMPQRHWHGAAISPPQTSTSGWEPVPTRPSRVSAPPRSCPQSDNAKRQTGNSSPRWPSGDRSTPNASSAKLRRCYLQRHSKQKEVGAGGFEPP
jgi:class 3 adenylate cyclase